MNNIKLNSLQDSDREQFILDNQEAFNYGDLEEFGLRDDHFEEDDQIISRETIEKSIDNGEAYRIMLDDRTVGGVIISVDGERGDLDILFISTKEHSKGVGYAAWCEVEKLQPEVKVWETVTPYFEKRNIHFYVNRCGFHIVEFYNKLHPDPNDDWRGYMIKKPIFLAYGIKLITTWMLIPFVLMFVPILVKEFSATFSTQDVVLQEETYSGYPDEYLCFKTNINGKERAVHAPVTAKTGDTITVILRNGEYYMTPKDSKDLYETTTFTGRFLKRCNNNFGYHVIAITVVLLITFLLTLGKKRLIRKEAPKLTKVTDITGIICSISMSAALIYGVVDNTLMGLGVAYMFLVLGMIYTAVFVVAWIIAMRYYSFEELKNE